MTRIFISYSHEDTVITKRLNELLSESFDHIWYDKELAGGEDWWSRIVNEIEQCNHFIFLISRDSLDSEFCRRELAEAQQHNKHIIPVRIRNKTQIPKNMAEHVIDMFQEITVEGLNQIYKSIIRNEQPNPADSSDSNKQQADLNLLRNIWPLINSGFVHRIYMSILNGQMTNDDLADHLWTYRYHRQKPQNTFINNSLESVFASFDQVSSQFQDSISENYTLVTIEGTVYRKSKEDDSLGQNKVLTALHKWELQHKQLVRIIKELFPSFDFDHEEKLQQHRDKLAHLLQEIRKNHMECGRLSSNLRENFADYFTSVSRIRFFCEEASKFAEPCPKECLQIELGSMPNPGELAALEEKCRYCLLFIAHRKLILLSPFENPDSIDQNVLVQLVPRNHNAINDMITSIQRRIEKQKPVLAQKENIFTLYGD